jgi:hypothetical protein
MNARKEESASSGPLFLGYVNWERSLRDDKASKSVTLQGSLWSERRKRYHPHQACTVE